MITKFFLLFLIISCHRPLGDGELFVSAARAGEFTIFRVKSTSPLQLVSEKAGHFNTEIPLLVGNYLIFGDCSHVFVTIKSGVKTELDTWHVAFVPPHSPQVEDSFSIQCLRFAATDSRQHFRNRFYLQLLTAQKKLLVGTMSLALDFTHHHAEYLLGGVRIAEPTTASQTTLFFVYPHESLLSVTSSQSAGHWLYLLPGKYIVEFNGISKTVEVQAGQKKTIHAALLRIETTKATAHPLASIGKNKIIPFNVTLPVLPTTLNLRLTPASQPLTVTLPSAKLITVKARSLKIISDCQARDYTCLGTTAVYLYQANEDVPFLVTATDRNTFFARQKIRVGIAGSQALTYHLPDQHRDTTLYTGKLKIHPRPVRQYNYLSDLLRLEAVPPHFSGHTEDLSLSTLSELTLLPGRYRLAHFTSSVRTPGKRRKDTTHIVIHPGREQHVTLDVFHPHTSTHRRASR